MVCIAMQTIRYNVKIALIKSLYHGFDKHKNSGIKQANSTYQSHDIRALLRTIFITVTCNRIKFIQTIFYGQERFILASWAGPAHVNCP